MTAFYMFRVIFMTFGGEYRGGEQGHGAHAHGTPHESPLVMLFPMVILALFAIGSGWAFWGGGAFEFLTEGHHHLHGFFEVLTEPLVLISLAVGIAGIILAYAMYSAKWISPERVGQAFAPIYNLFSRKYYFDELYERIFVVRVLYDGLFRLIELFDTYVVDGTVNGAAKVTVVSSSVVRRVQTGQLQSYGLAIVLGVLIIMAVVAAVYS